MVKFTQRNIQLKDRPSANRNVDRQVTFLLFALALGLYLRTMAPGLLAGDSGEFQFAAWRLGLAHATGYPLYMLLGWLWQHLLQPVAISPATALNALSALFGALAISTLYIVMRGWLEGPLVLRRAIAVFTVLLLTVNPTFWSQNLIAEVYTLHILLLLLLFWSIQRLQQPDEIGGTIPLSRLLCFALLLGLALTHHAMTLLILPSLFLYLGYVARSWHNKNRLWWPALLALVVAALPLLLYLYIPLRSGPQSSPWYHQPLGETTLTLYENDWASFINFITGRSISVGFNTFAQAWSHLTEARLLWQLHFQWAGLVLITLGLIFLVKRQNWPLLMLTLPYAILQQIFNLFYAIDDILVYYIPLYVVGVIWAGFGVQGLVLKAWQLGNENTQEKQEKQEKQEHDRPKQGQSLGIFVVVIACLLPLSLYRTYLPRLDQRESTAARQMWESILATEPPTDAILVSNDRNEIVPLFYLQHVEQRGLGMAGLFPLIKPTDDFADVGMVVESALKSGTRPVYLIKEMAGLEVKFSLKSVTLPLVQVVDLAASSPPDYLQGDNFGPLRLLGYNWLSHDDGKEVNQQNIEIALYWQVIDKIDRDYTTTIQLFDTVNEKIGQDDRLPGGHYYPTSLWKTGEILVDSHRLTLPIGSTPKKLQVGMYHNDDMRHLAPSLEIDLDTTLAK